MHDLRRIAIMYSAKGLEASPDVATEMQAEEHVFFYTNLRVAAHMMLAPRQLARRTLQKE